MGTKEKMNASAVSGEFPEFCYRAFRCECHARQFVESATMRLGCLRYYRNIEDSSRRDQSEGVACTKEPGIVSEGWVSPNPAEKTIWIRRPGHQTHEMELLNPKYCFCMSLPEVDLNHVRGTFGARIVKIDDPRRLAEDINEHFSRSGQRFMVEGRRVVYNKAEKLDRPLTDDERTALSYTQKPGSFRPDCEFRIVAIGLGTLCNEECEYLSGQFEQVEPHCRFLSLNLGRQLAYTQLC
jgi:hypothetical protein